MMQKVSQLTEAGLDDRRWQITVTEADLTKFHPFFTGNGRFGVRVGAMVLDWNGDSKTLLTEDGHDFWGRLNGSLLVSLGKHVYDGGDQMILAAWNQARLEVAGVEYCEANGVHQFRNTLDLRNGEVVFEDVWQYRPGYEITLRLRLVLPRSVPCAGWYELQLLHLSEPATLRIGLNAGQVAATFSEITFRRTGDTLLGHFTTQRQSRLLAQGMRWESSGWKEADWETGPDNAWLKLVSDGTDASLTVVHSVHCSSDQADPGQRVESELASLDAEGRNNAAETSSRKWKELWTGALDFRHPESRWERLVLVNQFHLLANLEEGTAYPLGPLGLTRPGWHGSQMWDADFWVFRALLLLWPELARSIVAFRRARLPAARANAEKHGLRGAFYPWNGNDDGHDITSPGYRNEIHNNVWIGLAAWEAAGTPPDRKYLQETTWPILEGIADFFTSRACRDDEGGWHIRGVLPPDESVGEGRRSSTGLCDNNVLTNVGARYVLHRAIDAAQILGLPSPAEWKDVAEGLVILKPDENGVIPEYEGYSGHLIKQADTILAFYPFELEVPEEIFRRNLEYYHEKTDRGGPLMTHQIEALLAMLHGDREAGLEHLFSEYERYTRGLHFIPFETPLNANSIMLTGIGGLLQALIYGWFRATPEHPQRIPRIGNAIANL